KRGKKGGEGGKEKFNFEELDLRWIAFTSFLT
ncbi:hypothetical protein KKC_07442, partial [Listeria fleischmannii subsp. coloradonensis]